LFGGEDFLIDTLADIVGNYGLIEDGGHDCVALVHEILDEGVTDLYGFGLVFDEAVEGLDLFVEFGDLLEEGFVLLLVFLEHLVVGVCYQYLEGIVRHPITIILQLWIICFFIRERYCMLQLSIYGCYYQWLM
jgi:hypothetical protein